MVRLTERGLSLAISAALPGARGAGDRGRRNLPRTPTIRVSTQIFRSAVVSVAPAPATMLLPALGAAVPLRAPIAHAHHHCWFGRGSC